MSTGNIWTDNVHVKLIGQHHSDYCLLFSYISRLTVVSHGAKKKQAYAMNE